MNSQIGKALSKAVPAGVFSSPGILSPPSLPTPASRRMGGGKVLGAEGAPASGLTFHAHAVVKAFVVQASVVGRAEMLPEVAAGPCPHGKHMRSAVPSRRPLPPHTRSRWTGDPSSPWRGCPWPGGPSGAQASQPEPPTDVLAEVPRGRAAETLDAPDGQLTDHGRRKGAVDSPLGGKARGPPGVESVWSWEGLQGSWTPTSSFDRWGNRSP